MVKEKCFIISPISTLPARAATYLNDLDHSQHVIDHLLAPAVERAGFEVVKPKAKGSNLIHAEIVQNLQTATLVLCDMSSLNPNVFFELGVRTAMNRPVCLIIDHATEDPPFDLGVVNHHKYVSDLRPWVLPGEIEKLATHIRESALNKQNALWNYFSLRVKAEVTEPSGPADKLDILVSEVDALRKQIADGILSRVTIGSTGAPSRVREAQRELIIDRLLGEARQKHVRVLHHFDDANGIVTFLVGPDTSYDAGLELITLARTLGVELTVGRLPNPKAGRVPENKLL
jgi:hypothetical protein